MTDTGGHEFTFALLHTTTVNLTELGLSGALKPLLDTKWAYDWACVVDALYDQHRLWLDAAHKEQLEKELKKRVPVDTRAEAGKWLAELKHVGHMMVNKLGWLESVGQLDSISDEFDKMKTIVSFMLLIACCADALD